MSNRAVKGIYEQAMAKDQPKNTAQKPEIIIRKDLDKDLNKERHKDLDKDGKKDVKPESVTRSHTLPTADEIEEVVFRFRKESKIRINADFPEAWKKELDEYAHQAGVGKYHLVMFAVGKMLGKI